MGRRERVPGLFLAFPAGRRSPEGVCGTRRCGGPTLPAPQDAGPVCLRAVSRTQDAVNAAKPLPEGRLGAWEPLTSSLGREPDLALVRSWVSLPKDTPGVLAKAVCCGGRPGRSSGLRGTPGDKAESQKLAQVGWGTRASPGGRQGPSGHHVTRGGALSRQRGSRSACGANSMPPPAPVTTGAPEPAQSPRSLQRQLQAPRSAPGPGRLTGCGQHPGPRP